MSAGENIQYPGKNYILNAISRLAPNGLDMFVQTSSRNFLRQYMPLLSPFFATQIAARPILTHITHMDIATMIPNVTNIHIRGNR